MSGRCERCNQSAKKGSRFCPRHEYEDELDQGAQEKRFALPAGGGRTLADALAEHGITYETSSLGAFLSWKGRCFGHADSVQAWVLIDMLEDPAGYDPVSPKDDDDGEAIG